MSYVTQSPVATYDGDHSAGVLSLVLAGAVSGAAILTIFGAVTVRSATYHNTHIVPYFFSLLIANVLQAAGTGMNAKWVLDGTVSAGAYCGIQGGVKQAGNVGMALWSFALSVHIFHLLFLRWKCTKLGLYLTLIGGWLAVLFIVIIGPLAIQTKEKGPYFGPSGYWCWITSEYPREQTYLEYFFEFLSAGLSFILYTVILLRVRGNLLISNGHWKLRFVPSGESWQLALSRDVIDASVLRVAALMVWYPVAYGILLLPVSITRLCSFGGHEIPFWATILADTIFSLQGLVNVILLLVTRRLFPDTSTLPTFATPRKDINYASSEAYGITPYILPPKPEPEVEKPASTPRADGAALDDVELGLDRQNSGSSVGSADSQTPMLKKWTQRLSRPASLWRR